MKTLDFAAALASLGPQCLAACRELDLAEAEIELAWELARLPVGLGLEDRRALLLLFLAVLGSQASGSTRLSIGDPLVQWLARIKSPDGSMDRIEALLRGGAATHPKTGVIGEPGDRRPLIHDGHYLYSQKLLAAEDALVAQVIRRWQTEAVPLDPVRLAGALEEVRRRAPRLRGRSIELSDEQINAVSASAVGRLTVISGGPGTGKTSIVVSIIRVLARLGIETEDISLAAPTGKAAQRLEHALREQLTGLGEVRGVDEALMLRPPEPRTLHRLLGYSPRTGRFSFHEDNLLAARVVIVDESSMIDLSLMSSLTKAVAPEAQLILLGDAEQLPSVEAGAVFRDLVGASELSADAKLCVRLKNSYRMDPSDPAGRQILLAAQAIQAGDTPILETDPTEAGVRRVGSVDDLLFEGVELLDIESSRELRPRFVERWFEDLVEDLPDFASVASKPYFIGEQRSTFRAEDEALIRSLLSHYESRRLLCATKGSGRPTGAASLNRLLHERRHDYDRSLDDGASIRVPELAPGEPIMMTTNDYHRELYNGDQGVVLTVSSRGRTEPMAVFARRDGLVAFPLGPLHRDLELAYAMTVHKAQGSEFDRVGLILPDEEIPVLSRELFYTALTRSRRSAVIVGTPEILAAAVRGKEARHCGLQDKLVARLGTRDGDHSSPPP